MSNIFFNPDDFILSGVGLAATNNYQFFVPVHGKTTHFDQTKVTPKVNDTLKIKPEGNAITQTGFGTEEENEKKDEILTERDLKRKLLGQSVFDLMSAPKIKTVKLDLLPKTDTKSSNKKPQKGEGNTSKVHIFKK
jgi:hypothetical protein